MLIGAYRDHEILAGHPLLVTLQALQQQGIVPHQIKLDSLDFESIEQLLSDTLYRDRETIAPLAALVAQKTAGNPFFIKVFLKSLHRERQLVFDTQQGVWQWNMERIQAEASTDNIIELLAGRIRQFPDTMRDSLKLAACLGSRFDLNTLTWASDCTVQHIAAILREAVIQGLLETIGNAPLSLVADTPQPTDETVTEFKFVHDRIQQAAYSLIPDQEKPATHWRIGQLLLQHVPAEQREDRIFIIVNQLNAGVASANASAERWQIAELNLLAGKKAKTAAAWESAFDYLKIGIILLEENDWTERYPFALALYEETVEAAYLNKNFELMEQLADSVSLHARTVLDRVKVYEVRIQAAMARNDPLEAIAIGLEILKALVIRFPEKPNQWHAPLAFLRTRWAWIGKSVEDLLDLPAMTNPSSLAAIRVLARILTASFAAAPVLMPLLIMAMTRLSLTHGNAPQSAFCYTAYGLSLTETSHDIEASYRFSQLALRLLKRFPTQQALPARVILISYGQNLVWKDDFKDTLPPLWRGYRIGLETGDFEFAAYCARAYFLNAFWGGKELNNLEQEMADYRDPIAHLAENLSLNAHFLPWQAVQNLLDRSEDPCRLIGAAFDERLLLQSRDQAKFGRTLLTFYLLKLQLCYLFEDYPQAPYAPTYRCLLYVTNSISLAVSDQVADSIRQGLQ